MKFLIVLMFISLIFSCGENPETGGVNDMPNTLKIKVVNSQLQPVPATITLNLPKILDNSDTIISSKNIEVDSSGFVTLFVDLKKYVINVKNSLGVYVTPYFVTLGANVINITIKKNIYTVIGKIDGYKNSKVSIIGLNKIVNTDSLGVFVFDSLYSGNYDLLVNYNENNSIIPISIDGLGNSDTLFLKKIALSNVSYDCKYSGNSSVNMVNTVWDSAWEVGKNFSGITILEKSLNEPILFSNIGYFSTSKISVNKKNIISIPISINNPVVFANIKSQGYDSIHYMLRLSNIKSNSFDVNCEYILDSSLVSDSLDISYLVISQGVWQLSNGKIIEVGKEKINKFKQTYNYKLSRDVKYSSLFTKLQTNNNRGFYYVRHNQNIFDGFNCYLEGVDTTLLFEEEMGYFVCDSGNFRWGGVDFSVEHRFDILDNNVSAFKLSYNIETKPIIGDLESIHGSNFSFIKFVKNSKDTLFLQASELNYNQYHQKESFSIFYSYQSNVLLEGRRVLF